MVLQSKAWTYCKVDGKYKCEDEKCVENAENGWISYFMGISTMKLYYLEG